MVILQQDLPLLKRLAMAVALASPPVDDLGALLAFAVGVGARIERVFEHRDHIAIADWRPLEGNQFLAVGGSWEVDLMLGH